VRRVTGYDVVVPLAELEAQFIPSERRILKAAYDVLNYS